MTATKERTCLEVRTAGKYFIGILRRPDIAMVTELMRTEGEALDGLQALRAALRRGEDMLVKIKEMGQVVIWKPSGTGFALAPEGVIGVVVGPSDSYYIGVVQHNWVTLATKRRSTRERALHDASVLSGCCKRGRNLDRLEAAGVV